LGANLQQFRIAEPEVVVTTQTASALASAAAAFVGPVALESDRGLDEITQALAAPKFGAREATAWVTEGHPLTKSVTDPRASWPRLVSAVFAAWEGTRPVKSTAWDSANHEDLEPAGDGLLSQPWARFWRR
jgi:hypothetical protein